MNDAFRAPLDLPPSPADNVSRTTAEMARWKTLADAVLTTPVIGVRGQKLDMAEAQQRADAFRDAIECEEASGSQRHRRVSLLARLAVLIIVAIIDFPLMFFVASSVFNVDWSNL